MRYDETKQKTPEKINLDIKCSQANTIYISLTRKQCNSNGYDYTKVALQRCRESTIKRNITNQAE